jgi:hypothetical protein
VTKSNQDEATFQIQAEQYSLAHAEAKNAAAEAAARDGTPVVPTAKSIFPASGFFGNPMRYKNKKPVPFVNKVVLVAGFLAGIAEELDGTTVKQRFLLDVDDVTFVGAPPPVASVTTPSSGPSGSGMLIKVIFKSILINFQAIVVLVNFLRSVRVPMTMLL